MMFSSVDLPAPDSPRIATSSPAAMRQCDIAEHGARARARERLGDAAKLDQRPGRAISAMAAL
jgi:hypothetical protein